MRRIVLATFIAVSAAASPATAQTSEQQWEWCGDASDQDRAIASCTSLIKSGQETLEKLALAYSNRGYYLSNKHQYDRAIPDLDQAIRLDPQNVLALVNRAHSPHGSRAV